MIDFLNTLRKKYSVKAGRLIKIFNRNRQGNENVFYTAVWVEDTDGTNERCLLFTEKELERAEKRSLKNPEDWVKKSFFTDLLD